MIRFTGDERSRKDFKEIIYEMHHDRVLAHAARALGLVNILKSNLEKMENVCNQCSILKKYNEDNNTCCRCPIESKEYQDMRKVQMMTHKEMLILYEKIDLALREKTGPILFRKIFHDRLFYSILFIIGGIVLIGSNAMTGTFWFIAGIIVLLLGVIGLIHDYWINNYLNKGSDNKNVLFDRKKEEDNESKLDRKTKKTGS